VALLHQKAWRLLLQFSPFPKRSMVRAKKIHSGKMNTAIMGFEIALKV
jgi:hypothetical protein